MQLFKELTSMKLVLYSQLQLSPTAQTCQHHLGLFASSLHHSPIADLPQEDITQKS